MHFVTTGIAFGLVYCNVVTSKTDLVCALFGLMQPYVCERCVSWKVLENAFLSPGKPWNLVFASPRKESLEKHCFNVCKNPDVLY